ncbi:MAG: PAS domain S-box protein [Colwelliaceae bacterium]|nr:PAS domain S-box protein [Colwelliaceae bacterium]
MIKLTENIQFDNIPYSVIFIDFNGLIKACNKHTKDLTGYSTEELIGKKIELLICDEMFNFQSQNYQTIPCKKNIQLINKTNKPIFVGP